MKKKSLNVSWKIDNPPVKPVRWFSWDEDFIKKPSPESEAVGKVLGWPEGVMAVLDEAFRRRLRRSQGWDASEVEAKVKAVKAAASCFRRGVGFRQSAEDAESTPREGLYLIDIHTGDGDSPPELPAGGWLIVDGNVASSWPEKLAGDGMLTMDLDEGSKTLDSVGRILEAWAEAGKPNSWTIVGGGILGDTAAFAAALVGATHTLVPTTLLAMADASVGGKTGVNYPPYGKNQVGAFHFPEAVIIWPGWLSTLDERQIRAGGSECLKHAFLGGDLVLAERLVDAISRSDRKILGELLEQVISFKADVVGEDPGESGRRAILNFGHTIAHALESISLERAANQRILHGEAVAVGSAFAILLSTKHAGLDTVTAGMLRSQLERSGCLPNREELFRCLGGERQGDNYLWPEIEKLIVQDKKAGRDKKTTNWVLLDAPGKVSWVKKDTYTIELNNMQVCDAWKEFIDSY